MGKIKVFKNLEIGKIDDRIHSSFIEHMGRSIYTGIYEPGHPTADEQGFRQDVIEMVRDLNVSHVRYPGGNFLSGYNWEDGVGDYRPRRLDLAWLSTERNEIGIDEFVDWSKKTGTQIMGAVNMGTGTPSDAARLLEYTNFPGNTELSDRRIKNGHQDPHNIKVWCLGNEMDGPWQICHLDADDYGKKARETAKMMKWIQEDLELVVVGSSGADMPTFPEWDRKVLEYTYEHVDFISLHAYYWNKGNEKDFLCSHIDLNNFIKTVASTVKYVKALKRSEKDVYLSIDEWNIWDVDGQGRGNWQDAPRLIEDNYTVIDAVAFGGLVITLLNNCDTVKMACLAQLVNVIAPIMTEPAGACYKQTTYYPFEYFNKFGNGMVLKTINEFEEIESIHGKSDVIITSTVVNDKYLTVFAMNSDTENAHILDIDFSEFGKVHFEKAYIISSSNKYKTNTLDTNNNFEPKITTKYSNIIDECSFVVYRFKVGENND